MTAKDVPWRRAPEWGNNAGRPLYVPVLRGRNLTGSQASAAITDPIADRQPWAAEALCSEVGSDWWFPEKGGPLDAVRRAKAVCGACPVKASCLEFALETGPQHGIWGGLSPRQIRRARLAAGRAA